MINHALATQQKKLTPKQENFCQEYVITGNASEAYRRSYHCDNMQQNTIWKCANRLLDNPHVRGRIEEIQALNAERNNITIDLITRELEQARVMAIKAEIPASMVSASMSKAKLHGLLIDKKEVTGQDGRAIEFTQINRVIVD